MVDFLEIISRKNNIFEKVSRFFSVLTGVPSNVATQVISRTHSQTLMPLIAIYQPNVVWLDGIYAGLAAAKIAEYLNIPMIARSHNIEHLYMKGQAKAEKAIIKKLTLKLALLHLKSFEFKTLSNSLAFYDISVDDLNFWKTKGLKNGGWLPPVIVPAPSFKNVDKQYDIVFLGNLYAPNNVEGVIWFVTKVFSKILDRYPSTSLAIAGSNPVHQIERVCALMPNIVLIKNPKDSAEIYSSGRVLINPVLNGSGMNIKSVEMLFYNKPIITTNCGVGGMPDSIKSNFFIADGEVEFANEVCKALVKSESKDTSIDPSEIFGQEAINNLVSKIHEQMRMLLN